MIQLSKVHEGSNLNWETKLGFCSFSMSFISQLTSGTLVEKGHTFGRRNKPSGCSLDGWAGPSWRLHPVGLECGMGKL